MAFKAKCSETNVRHPRIVFEEKASKLTVLNASRKPTTKVLIDGCQITNGIRCDHLLIEEEKENFIELKGTDIDHALEQLTRTIRLLSFDFRKHPKRSFIICSRSPMSSAKIQGWQLKFRRDFNSDLIVKSSPYEFSI